MKKNAFTIKYFLYFLLSLFLLGSIITFFISVKEGMNDMAEMDEQMPITDAPGTLDYGTRTEYTYGNASKMPKKPGQDKFSERPLYSPTEATTTATTSM
jgi:hypothetical protein